MPKEKKTEKDLKEKKTKSLNAEQKRQIIQRFESFKDCNDWIGVGDKFIDQYCRYKNYEIEAIRRNDRLAQGVSP